VLLLHLKFGSILNRHDAFSIRNVAGQNIQNGRLAGTGSAGDQ
jgi:hypothetical protein